ncbi:DoxX family protein [Echinicola jeungdonensis]|uniref:DoxX family protein n=1 Tax=Echinicola jeungdonensis TaxID=709343 RepID=A0ABV5J160_9BACT|nr:DoxX family protein [Echinicola jeungdonensis]MDN3668387.1 DoxX family protein [Echinicola jeungdonensis]
MKKLIFNQSILLNLSTLALIFRLALGVIFFAHGAQKVLGWYGGFGLEGTVGWMNGELGIPVFLAYISCFVEFLGGIFLILGFLTRVWAGALAINMLVAILIVHSGFFNPDGIEFPFAVMVLAIGSFLAGPGKLSIDANLGKN